MTFEEELGHNRLLLNRCKKIYSKLFVFYIATFAAYLILTFMMLLATVIQHDSLFLFFDALLLCPFLIFLSINATYKHHDLSAVGIPAILGVNQFILFIASKFVSGEWCVLLTFRSVEYCMWIHLVVLLASIPTAILNAKTNNVYHKLEESVGFPYFNLRVEEQRMDKIARTFQDPFQYEFDNYMRHSSSEMSDLETTDKTSEKYISNKKPDNIDSIYNQFR